MLILSRNIGEVVRIGDDIAVTVVAVHGHQVRFGINAPRDVVVDREEIANRKQHERAIGLVAEIPATAIAPEATVVAPEATVSGGQFRIRVTRRRVRTEAVQSSSLSPALPPTPERGKKPTLRIGSPRSKITGT